MQRLAKYPQVHRQIFHVHTREDLDAIWKDQVTMRQSMMLNLHADDQPTGQPFQPPFGLESKWLHVFAPTRYS